MSAEPTPRGALRVSVAPRATYRLQLTPEFGFEAAAARVPYVARVGVSHLYLSPITEAVPGSAHGYDVTDPTRVRAELGGDEGFARLVAAVRKAGLGLLVDVVPNHMATDARVNPYWRDVLEDGQQSPYASWFDIDWSPPDPELRGRVMVPILGESLEATLAAGELEPARSDAGLVVRVPGAELPLALATVAPLLGAAAVRSGSETLAELGTEAMLLLGAAGAEERQARFSARQSLRTRMAALFTAEPDAARAVDEMVAALVRDRRRLRALVDAQAWLLDGWREGTRRLNHRRFFTISSLAGVRAEVPEQAVTGAGRILELVAAGDIDGLRLDHIDGLRDPAGYLQWLAAAAPGRWVLVEKIVAPGEHLPPGWACAGTTGYEFGARLLAMSLDPHGISVLEVLRDVVAGPRPEFGEMARAAKLELLAGDLAPEWGRVVRDLDAVAATDPRLVDYPEALRDEALRELVTALAVYRTYVADDGRSSAADRAALHAAVSHAAVAGAGVPRRLLESLAEILGGSGWDQEGRCAALAARVQQTTPALMAKGVEDTAIYRDASLLARDEVGAGADWPLLDGDGFHAAAVLVQAEWPQTLLATSTHDSKRSEDVRARLCALSELASGWAPTVRDWASRYGHLDPGGDAMLILLQTLVGAWPIDAERATAYMVKATREAGERTTWTAPDAAYEPRLEAMVTGLVGDTGFVAELEEVVAGVRPLGERISLAWTLLRLTSPGIPDTYQGTEVWDLSLVDPDNRRPVDYPRREALLEDALTASPEELLERSVEGLPKLAVVARALGLRHRRAELFDHRGDYRPLAVSGEMAAHAVAFSRGADPGAVVIAPRLPAAIEAGWRGTAVALPQGTWRNLFTDAVFEGGEEAVVLDEALGGFPVALLERVGG